MSTPLFAETEPSAPLINKAEQVSRAKPANRANDLDGKTWTRNSISIWSDIRKTSEESSLKHPAMFPLGLVSRLIECFTKDTDKLIFDPFAGVGTTIIAAKQAGKTGVGTELSEQFAEIANRRAKTSTLLDEESRVGEGIVYRDDALNLLRYVKESSVDLVVTSPPYWDILNQTRTADYKEIRNYGNYENDLGTVSDYKDFLGKLALIFQQVFSAMKPGAYMCVVVMDIRKKDKFYPFHSDLAEHIQQLGFIYDDLIIWDRRHEYNNMRPLGFPSVFRINKVHEFILIFQKPKAKKEK